MKYLKIGVFNFNLIDLIQFELRVFEMQQKFDLLDQPTLKR